MKTAFEYYKEGIRYSNVRKNFEDAIKAFSKAIELNPDDADYYYSRGASYFELKKYSNAIEDFSKAIELNPTDAVYYSPRAICYRELKQFEKAIEDYSKIIELKSARAKNYSDRAACYEEIKDYGRAIEDYITAIEMEPDNIDIQLLRTECYKKQGEYSKAIQGYETLMENGSSEDDKKKYEKTINELILAKPINVLDCKGDDLKIFECFDDEKIEKFVSARENGLMWYNLDSFCDYFNVEPHERVQFKDKVIFPPKPAAKMGRSLDL